MILPHDRVGTAQGIACATSNSIVMSGTPTDVSGYYNQQTFFQVNYIGNSAHRQGPQVNPMIKNGRNVGVDKQQPFSLNKFRNNRNRGGSNSRYQPTQYLNNYGGLSSLSNNTGNYQYPNSAGGFYRDNTI